MAFSLACPMPRHAAAQLGGARAGTEPSEHATPTLPLLERDVVESFITIDGRAEIRVRPTEMRLVLAVTSEGTTAEESQQAVGATIAQLKAAWANLHIPAEDVVEDFVAVLPVYQWNVEQRGETEIGVEKKTGYQMQTNIHLRIPNDNGADAPLLAAFTHGVADIIAVDYARRDLDDVKVQARAQAMKVALRKADALLGALFDERPAVINLQEETTVRYPQSLYQSFENRLAEGVTPAWRRNLPLIHARRPKNTYYRGLDSGADSTTGGLPMRPEISVVSTVRLYFESPAARRRPRE
jgi:uncharacterized protein YggE